MKLQIYTEHEIQGDVERAEVSQIVVLGDRE